MLSWRESFLCRCNNESAMPTYEQIRDDFEFIDDWEERFSYVIELAKGLPEFSEDARSEANRVRGCASQVWLDTTIVGDTPGPRLHFVGDSDAILVRGLIAILLAMYDNKTADEALKIDAHAHLAELGLDEHLTPQRSNGLKSMVERIRADATAAQSATTS